MSRNTFADIPRRAPAKQTRAEVVTVDRALFYSDGELYEFIRVDVDDE